MAVPNRRIGQASDIENILLSDIEKQINRLVQVISNGGGGGSGTVTSVSVVSANGFAGSVATATTTPAITISTTVTGILKGNGTAISAAIAGTDYLAPNGSGAALTGVYLLASGGTLTGNNTFVQAGFNTTYTGIGKVTFSPTLGGGSVSGLNVGVIAGAPATTATGDIFYNSTIDSLMSVISGTVRCVAYFASTGNGGNNRVILASSTNPGLLKDTTNLTFVTNRLIGTVLYLTLSAGSATAGTCPLVMTTGTLLTAAIAGGIEYNNTFHMTNSDATRRHVVLAASATKTTAGAPYANDGYITVNIGGTDVRLMTTA